MRILLLNPIWSYTQRYLPVNLAELAGYIRAQGYQDIHILDLNNEVFNIIDPKIKFSTALSLVKNMKPDIIGITCQTIHVPFCIKFSKMLKRALNVPIILGGIHATFRPQQLFKLCQIDYIVRGEGEETFVELLDYLAGKNDRKALKNIAGISYRDRGKLRHNVDRPIIKDISELPFPAYDLLRSLQNRTSIDPKPLHSTFRQKPARDLVPSISASRGCPYRCLFCSSNRMWQYQRRKPVKRVLEEIDYQCNKLKTDTIEFEDDCLTLNKKWLRALMAGLKSRGIKWSCFSRIDQIDFELLKTMKASGCVSIYHGIEAGNLKMRKIVEKKYPPNFTNEDIIALVKKEIELKIAPTCSFMVGIPMETAKDFNETTSLAVKLKNIGADTQLWIMTPYPDTPAVKTYKKYLKKADRWGSTRQGDVFFDEQLVLFHDVLAGMENENPDKYIFQTKMKPDKFLANYEKALAALGLGRSYIKLKGCFIHNYFHYSGKGLRFIDFQHGTKVRELSRQNKQAKSILLNISVNNFNPASYIKKLNNQNIQQCFISISAGKSRQARHFVPKLCLLLNYLIDNNVKFLLTKPLPKEFLNKELKRILNRAAFYPRRCADCLELFKIDEDRLVLCGGIELGSPCAFNGRLQLFGFFKEIATNNPHFINSHPCFSMINSKTKKTQTAKITLDRQYKMSPGILLAKIIKKNRHVTQIMRGKTAQERFQDIKFIEAGREISKPAKLGANRYILFNKQNEEILLPDESKIILLGCIEQGYSLADLSKGLTKNNRGTIKRSLSELVQQNIITVS